jgi:hypothetical protein
MTSCFRRPLPSPPAPLPHAGEGSSCSTAVLPHAGEGSTCSTPDNPCKLPGPTCRQPDMAMNPAGKPVARVSLPRLGCLRPGRAGCLCRWASRPVPLYEKLLPPHKYSLHATPRADEKGCPAGRPYFPHRRIYPTLAFWHTRDIMKAMFLVTTVQAGVDAN